MINLAHLAAVILGFMLDWFLGDPAWLPHPVRGIGRLIKEGETFLRHLLPRSLLGERLGGVLLVLLVAGSAYAIPRFILDWLALRSFVLAFVVETFMCYQLLATKSLQVESMKVYAALQEPELDHARQAVAMIVGRDTENLDASGITKATIETVAENVTDGVVAPLFYLMIGGAPLGFLYKSVNTMDSMIGYRNEKYRYFGEMTARLDDLLNFLPARLAGLLMVGAAYILGYQGNKAWQIFWRDRHNHASPNSAHTEAACAGALNIQLAGNAFYFGQLYKKPTIGDPGQVVLPADIIRSNHLMKGTALLTILLFAGIRILFVIKGGV
jgi:adenosylcobinamide-phosphate synthase